MRKLKYIANSSWKRKLKRNNSQGRHYTRRNISLDQHPGEIASPVNVSNSLHQQKNLSV